MDNTDDKAIPYLLNKMYEVIKNDKIDTSSAFQLIIIAMETMEKYKTKDNKKTIIIEVFKILVKSNDKILSTEIKEILEPIVNNEVILGGIIDMIYLASKGKLKINKNRKRCFCL